MLYDILTSNEENPETTTTQPATTENNSVKWYHKFRFGLKFWLHVLLLFTASVQLLVDNTESEYLLSARRNWLHFFYPPNYEINLSDDQATAHHFLFTQDELMESMLHALTSYESISHCSIDTLSYLPSQDFIEPLTPPPPALLLIKRYTTSTNKKTLDRSVEEVDFLVNSTSFKSVGLLTYLRSIVSLTLRFQLVSSELIAMRRSCLVWQIDVYYRFQSRGQVSMSLQDSILRDCDDSTSPSDLVAIHDLLWINVLLLIFSFLYLCALVMDQKKALPKSSWFWRLSEVVCLGCICYSSFMNLYENSARKPTGFVHSFLISLGQGLLWINLLQYFSASQNVLILTLERTIPRVFKFLLEVAPIFVGYAVFGVSYFASKTTRFSSLRNAIMTLFSLLNGDAVGETFRDLLPISSVIAQGYLYSFIMLGSYVVLNIIIALVEESFYAVKELKTGRIVRPAWRARNAATRQLLENEDEEEEMQLYS